ncbi:hypothetical protein RSAG8_08370, partial [Rhizoctonia solani AG-8 WAC10335]
MTKQLATTSRQAGMTRSSGLITPWVCSYLLCRVDARNENHVSEAVKFADERNLRLVVKIRDTTLSFLYFVTYGFAKPGLDLSLFSALTHHLKRVNFTSSFIGAGCSGDETAQSAVTVGAAELWIDVYKAAENHNATVVGGAAQSVGAAGGWVQGGGHSPISGFKASQMVDALQFKVVKPDGQLVAANECQNQDLFWALHGGSVVAMIINTTNSEKLSELSEVFLQALPNITDQGLRGYGGWT